jgi:Clp amino terminal domain, pathogenicity island component
MGEALGYFVLSLVMGPALLLVHELGHAAAVVLLTGERTLVVVGSGERYAGLRFGRVRIHFFGNDKGGRCEFPPNVTPRDAFVASLAGPAASALAAIVLVWALLAFGRPVAPMVILGLGALVATLQVVGNLVPLVYDEGPSDGWYAREAWRRWHGTPAWRVPVAEVEEKERRDSFGYRLMTAAVDEARALDAHHIGTEHLLLALAGFEHPVGEVLRSAGLTPGALRGALGNGRTGPPAAELRNTPALKRVLAGAVQQQNLHGDDELGPKHALLALLQERDAQARTLVERSGSSAASLHVALLRASAA